MFGLDGQPFVLMFVVVIADGLGGDEEQQADSLVGCQGADCCANYIRSRVRSFRALIFFVIRQILPVHDDAAVVMRDPYCDFRSFSSEEAAFVRRQRLKAFRLLRRHQNRFQAALLAGFPSKWQTRIPSTSGPMKVT